MTIAMRPSPVWVSLPQDADDEPARGIELGDSYIVETSTGEQLWAVFDNGAFTPCDDEGNEIATAGYSCPVALDNVSRVMIRGYAPGFGPSCPKAGAAPEIHLVVIQPREIAFVSRPVLDRVIAESMAHARRLMSERYHAHPPINFREPITSPDRDTRHQESL